MTSVRERNTTDPRLSIVIPAMNEARNLEVVLPALPPVHEVILVDGHSVDDTVETAQRLLPDVKVVRQTRTGKGNALACGFQQATGDIVVMFDADGSADPSEIPRFVEALVAGADFAKGSRFRAGGGSHDITRFRSLGNKGLNLITNLMLRTGYTDLCYGYNAFWSDILEDLDLPSPTLSGGGEPAMLWGDGFEIETVINCRVAAAELRVVEVPSVERSRVHGESNLNAISDGTRVLRTIVTEKRRAGQLRSAVAAVELVDDLVALPAGAPAATSADGSQLPAGPDVDGNGRAPGDKVRPAGEVALRSEQLTWAATDEGVVALDLRTSRYLGINNSAAELWHLLAEGTSAPALVTALQERFGLDSETAQRDVTNFLADLSERSLLVTG